MYKLEKLYDKLERLNKPKYHENGRKKRKPSRLFS